ncbi:MAG: TlpA disulfide reductase family protein [Polyangiaceae bacterium]
MPLRLPSVLSTLALSVALSACSSTPNATEPTGEVAATTTTTAATSSAPKLDPSKDPAMNVVGKQAPEFTLDSIDGEQVSLSDFHGKNVVILDFWETTCDPCLKEMPHLVKLYEKYKDRGLVVLAVSLDGPEELSHVNSVVHDKGMDVFHVLLDPQTSVYAKYTPKNDRPYTVVIGKNGAIADEHGSYVPGDEKKLEELIAKLLP